MRIKALKGTNDYLPEEAALREYIEQTILECYRENGFRRIMTPAIEDIENLDKSDGGENLNLIFKIMKRGEKLDEAIALNDKLLPVANACFSEVNPIPVKAAMNMLGFNAGTPRAPLTEIEPQNAEKLANAMKTFGMVLAK